MKPKKQVLIKETTLKKPSVSVFLGYPLYDEVAAVVPSEPVRGMSAFVMEVFRYGWNAYRVIGSLKELKALESWPAGCAITSQRISAERCALLAEALNLILQRGNSAIIEAVERYLIDKAGRFGDPRK